MTIAKPVLARLMPKTAVTESGCWEFTGARGPDGYARIHHKGGAKLAHRVSYEQHVGPIPDGLTIDHLCRNRGCVNPDHLEAVTQRENILRGLIVNHAAKTHCPNGHPYDEENTYWAKTPRGTPTPSCVICGRAAGARYRARKRAEKASV